MRFKLKWTEYARGDLDALYEYIALDSRFFAQRYVQRILLATEKLKSLPTLGGLVPEADRDDVREILFEDYRIIYRTKPKLIEILTVVHGSRDLGRAARKPWQE